MPIRVWGFPIHEEKMVQVSYTIQGRSVSSSLCLPRRIQVTFNQHGNDTWHDLRCRLVVSMGSYKRALYLVGSRSVSNNLFQICIRGASATTNGVLKSHVHDRTYFHPNLYRLI